MKRGFKNGDTTERIHASVDVAADGCWLWRGGSRLKGGYVGITVGASHWLAHRWSYEVFVGPIPGGMTIDHLCRNPSCVNPEHLEVVTQRENNLRAPTSMTFVNSVKTHCPHGHTYDEANTYFMPSGGRDCRKCINRRAADYKRRKAVDNG